MRLIASRNSLSFQASLLPLYCNQRCQLIIKLEVNQTCFVTRFKFKGWIRLIICQFSLPLCYWIRYFQSEEHILHYATHDCSREVHWSVAVILINNFRVFSWSRQANGRLCLKNRPRQFLATFFPFHKFTAIQPIKWYIFITCAVQNCITNEVTNSMEHWLPWKFHSYSVS
jgi:hypothetical protein